MPIYVYACEECKTEHEVLQKLSDGPIKACPDCGSGKVTKQVTAAAFTLKGSGWYETDFKGGKKNTSEKTTANKPTSDKATTEKATTEKATTEKASTKDSSSASSNTAISSTAGSSSVPNKAT